MPISVLKHGGPVAFCLVGVAAHVLGEEDRVSCEPQELPRPVASQLLQQEAHAEARQAYPDERRHEHVGRVFWKR